MKSPLYVASVAALLGCTPTTDIPPLGSPPPPHVASTRGSAVVVSRDERVAVMTSRSAGFVSVFPLNPGAGFDALVGAPSAEFDLGAGSEPWAAVIGVDDDTAYFILRNDHAVRRIVKLKERPTLDSIAVSVGSEPSAIAIAPSGQRLFVANWGEGTISVVTTDPFEKEDLDIDLNEVLLRPGTFGNLAPRPGLAHPRALAVTDDGDADDRDETLYATEFYSQPFWRPEDPTDPTQFDRNRQGVVYAKRLGTAEVMAPVTLDPVTLAAFPDSNEAATGCFPNQLYAAAVAGNRLYVSGMCASPAGPTGSVTNAEMVTNTANFKTLVHPTLFVIDTSQDPPVELPNERIVLTEKLEQLYADDESGGSTAPRRMPLLPNDIAVASPRPGSSSDERAACLTAMGADALFCLVQRADGWDVGAPGARYTDLHAPGLVVGQLPIGVALGGGTPPRYALVANDNSQNLSVVDLGRSVVTEVQAASTAARAIDVKDSAANQGRALFATGLGVWSFQGQAWSSCESCHPDGLSDGLTWFFARGPRRSISSAGTYTRDADGNLLQRLLLWTASIDEVHDVEVIARGVQGGAGGILRTYPDEAKPSNDLRIIYDGAPLKGAMVATPTLLNNLNGSLADLVSAPETPTKAWNRIDAYLQSVRTPRPPVGLDPTRVTAGRELFRSGRCAGCHAGPAWTLSRRFFTPSAANNGALPPDMTLVTPETLPTLLGALRTTSYSVPPQMLALNPPGSSGSATLRSWNPLAPEVMDLVTYAYSLDTAARDQINCALRDVGTFPPQPTDGTSVFDGSVAAGALPVREVRQNMATLALGATGYNIPSLLGLAVGAPYFHAGNARTLEEAFHGVFAKHYQALAPSFLADGPERAEQVRNLVTFLLSISDETQPETLPPGDATTTFEPDLCPR